MKWQPNCNRLRRTLNMDEVLVWSGGKFFLLGKNIAGDEQRIHQNLFVEETFEQAYNVGVVLQGVAVFTQIKTAEDL